jgi:uncharacterized protein YjbI with pentapeptide repeats
MQVLVPRFSFFPSILGLIVSTLLLSSHVYAMEMTESEEQNWREKYKKTTQQCNNDSSDQCELITSQHVLNVTKEKQKKSPSTNRKGSAPHHSSKRSQDSAASHIKQRPPAGHNQRLIVPVSQLPEQQTSKQNNQDQQIAVPSCQGQPSAPECQGQYQAPPTRTQWTVDDKGKEREDTCSTRDLCSPQVTGATITRADCTNLCQNGATFAQITPKTTLISWYVADVKIGHRVTYLNWGGITWNDIMLERMKIKRVNAFGVVWDNVYFGGQFKHLYFNNGNIQNSTFTGRYKDVDFKRTLLQNVVFLNARFEQKHLKHSNFDGATIENVSFRNCSFSGTTFRDAFLKNVTFDCSSIKETTYFSDANFWNGTKWVKLTGDHLKQLGADLTRCKQNALNTSAWMSQY